MLLKVGRRPGPEVRAFRPSVRNGRPARCKSLIACGTTLSPSLDTPYRTRIPTQLQEWVTNNSIEDPVLADRGCSIAEACSLTDCAFPNMLTVNPAGIIVGFSARTWSEVQATIRTEGGL